MAKINKRLLPIKAHFLFFMAAMGPILPQLSVLGKQIGISPEVMGYITSVLPILYVIAKPVFGFIADYFLKFRKLIFLVLILLMTFSFGAFYFIPENTIEDASNNTIPFNVSFNLQNNENCTRNFMISPSVLNSSFNAICSTNSSSFEAYISVPNDTNIVIMNRVEGFAYICFLNLTNFALNQTSFVNRSASCIFKSQEPGVYSSMSFWLFVILMCAGTIGFNVVNSISDAICFDMLGGEEDKYGAQRVWGTIGFGVTALIAGIAVDLWTADAVKSFAPALVIMFIFSGLDVLSVTKLKLPKLTASESIWKDVWELITHPAIAVFLVFATIAGIIDSFIIYFMFWHLEEVAAETGFMEQIKLIEGLVVAAECLAGEVPFFFYSGKIIKKLGYVHCMSLCFFFYAVRLGLIAWIPNPWYLVLVELFFQGVTYALCYTCIVAYASAVAPPGTSATVQGLIAGMDDGLGYSIGSLIGGIAFKNFGGRRSFAYFSVLAICTCVAHILVRPTSRKQQYLPKTGYQLPNEQKAIEKENETKI